MQSIFEQAKRQDDEREVQKDEKIYETTGKNIAYDENTSDPLVPIDGYRQETQLSMAQRAKAKRIMDKHKNLVKNRKEKIKQKIEEHTKNFKNGTSFLETQ